MTREYLLTQDPVTLKRVKKMIQEVIKETRSTRDIALEGYEYFKSIVDQDLSSETDECKKCMVACLKVASDSRANAVKLFDTLIKTFTKTDIQDAKDAAKGSSIGDLLGDD